MRHAAIFTVLLIVPGLGCHYALPALQGSGVKQEETREVGEFNGRVEVNSVIDATIRIGAKPSLHLSGDDNLVPLVTTTVRDGGLVLAIKDNTSIKPNLPLKAEITIPKLEFLKASGAAVVNATANETERFDAHASGASRVTIDGIKASSVSLNADGASQLTADGATQKLDAAASGAAQLHAGKLAADSINVTLSGAARASLTANDEVSGDVSGASSLEVAGQATKRNARWSGASSVKYLTK